MRIPLHLVVLLAISALSTSPITAQVLSANLSFGVVDTTGLAATGTGNGSVEVLYSSSIQISLFQFDVTTVGGVTVTGAFGGDAAAAGIIVSTGLGTCGCQVVGLSFFTPPIPAGSGVLTNLSFTGTVGDQLCLGGASNGTGLVDPAGLSVSPPNLTFGPCVTLQAPPLTTYPGSLEDLSLGTGINGPPTGGPGFDIKTAIGGDNLVVLLSSPTGTFDGRPFLIVAEAFATGSPPASALPGLIYPSLFGFVVLVDGVTPSAAGLTPQILPGGSSYGYGIPAGLGGTSVFIQGLAFDPAAANGFFAATDAHELQLL